MGHCILNLCLKLNVLFTISLVSLKLQKLQRAYISQMSIGAIARGILNRSRQHALKRRIFSECNLILLALNLTDRL